MSTRQAELAKLKLMNINQNIKYYDKEIVDIDISHAAFIHEGYGMHQSYRR